MATLAALKAYFSDRLGEKIDSISSAPATQWCFFCGQISPKLRVTAGTDSWFVCGDLAGCESRSGTKRQKLTEQEREFEKYVAGLEIPEEPK